MHTRLRDSSGRYLPKTSASDPSSLPLPPSPPHAADIAVDSTMNGDATVNGNESAEVGNSAARPDGAGMTAGDPSALPEETSSPDAVGDSSKNNHASSASVMTDHPGPWKTFRRGKRSISPAPRPVLPDHYLSNDNSFAVLSDEHETSLGPEEAHIENIDSDESVTYLYTVRTTVKTDVGRTVDTAIDTEYERKDSVPAKSSEPRRDKSKSRRRHKKQIEVIYDEELSSSSSTEDEETGHRRVDKGKGVDPGNWGNLGIPANELDPVAQRKILDSMKQEEPDSASRANGSASEFESAYSPPRSSSAKRKARTPKDKHKELKKRNKLRRQIRRDSGMSVEELSDLEKEISQVFKDPLSAAIRKKKRSHSSTHRSHARPSMTPVNRLADGPLAHELGMDHRLRGGVGTSTPATSTTNTTTTVNTPPDPDSSSSDSSSSSSDSDSDDSDGDSTTSDESSSTSLSSSSSQRSISSRRRRHRRGSHGRRSRGSGHKRTRKHRHSHSRHAERVIKVSRKLEPPSFKYSGTPDPTLYLKFIRECNEYVKDAGFRKKEFVLKISRFLEGKAYDFYDSMVSDDPYDWTLSQFFRELMNYCFPTDFKDQQRAKVNHFKQHQKDVMTYGAELYRLLQTAGISSDAERVQRLWDGLNNSVKTEMLRKGVSVENSSWQRLLRKAIEAERIVNLDSRYSTRSRRDTGDRSNKSNSNIAAGSSNRAGSSNQQGGSSRRDNGRDCHQRRDRENNGQGGNGRRTNDRRNSNYSSCRTPNRDGKPSESRSKPSKQEQERLRVENRCFNCGETGHYADKCPKRKMMSGSRKGKPPGLPFNNVELDLEAIDEMQDLAATTEEINSITLASIVYGSDIEFISTDGDSDSKSYVLSATEFSDMDFEYLPEIDSGSEIDLEVIMASLDTQAAFASPTVTYTGLPSLCSSATTSVSDPASPRPNLVQQLCDEIDSLDMYSDPTDSVVSDDVNESSTHWSDEDMAIYPGASPEMTEYYCSGQWRVDLQNEPVEWCFRPHKSDNPVGYDYYGPWRYAGIHPSYGSDPQVIPKRFGLAWAERARYLLDSDSPYPGDSDDQIPNSWGRFTVSLDPRNDRYCVTDGYLEDIGAYGHTIEIPRHLLEEPTFQISKYYAQRRANRLELDINDWNFRSNANMGDALVEALEALLHRAHSCFDTISPIPTRIQCEPARSKEYVLIYMEALGYEFMILRSLLQNPAVYVDPL